MKRPSNAFLHDDIAAHLGARDLEILADAEEYQSWDYSRQRLLFRIARDDAQATLEWLQDTLKRGQEHFGTRWPAVISVIQARSHITSADDSDAAHEIIRADASREAITDALMSILAPDDRYTVLFERDAMAGERISTEALLAMLDNTHDVAKDAVRAAITKVSLDVFGFDVSEDSETKKGP